MERPRSELPVTIDTDFSSLSNENSSETTQESANPTDPTIDLQELLLPAETEHTVEQAGNFLDFQYKAKVAESQRRLDFCQKKYDEVLNSIATVETNLMNMPAGTRAQLLDDLPLLRDYWEQQIVLVEFPAKTEAEQKTTNSELSETVKEQVAKFHFPVTELSLPLKKLIFINQSWCSQLIKINQKIATLQDKKNTRSYFEAQSTKEELVYKIQEIAQEIKRRTQGDEKHIKIAEFVNEVTAIMPITAEHSLDTQIETQAISLETTKNRLDFLYKQENSPEKATEIALLEEQIKTTQQKVVDLQQKRNTQQYQETVPAADLEEYTQISTDQTGVFKIPRSKPVTQLDSRIKRGIKKISGIFFRKVA